MRLQLKPTTHYTQSKFSHYKNKLNTNCKFKFPLRILIQSQIDQISKFSKILKKKTIKHSTFKTSQIYLAHSHRELPPQLTLHLQHTTPTRHRHWKNAIKTIRDFRKSAREKCRPVAGRKRIPPANFHDALFEECTCTKSGSETSTETTITKTSDRRSAVTVRGPGERGRLTCSNTRALSTTNARRRTVNIFIFYFYAGESRRPYRSHCIGCAGKKSAGSYLEFRRVVYLVGVSDR